MERTAEGREAADDGDGVQAASYLDVRDRGEEGVVCCRWYVNFPPLLRVPSFSRFPLLSFFLLTLLPSKGIEALIHQAAAQQRYWLLDSPVTRIEGLTEEKLAEAVQVAGRKVREEAGAV